MSKSEEKLRDSISIAALQAMITKSECLSLDGSHGRQASEEELNKAVFDTCRAAYYYADAMLAERERTTNANT